MRASMWAAVAASLLLHAGLVLSMRPAGTDEVAPARAGLNVRVLPATAAAVPPAASTHAANLLAPGQTRQPERQEPPSTAGRRYLPTAEVDEPAEPVQPWRVDLRGLGLAGAVMARAKLWIGADGRLDRFEIALAQEHPGVRERLDGMLRSALFRPAVANGRPVRNYRDLELQIDLSTDE